ncbi:MAG: MmgE/PrpD family protein [Chloroflexi bacterium]|nr:MmgE/PrpD family protein [Chloroflexota bacterium]
MPDSLSRSYARFVSSLEYGQLPGPVVDKLKASVLHAMAVSIIGAQTHHGAAAIALTKEEDGKADGATILVDGTKATRGGAAFANSKLMHATNQTDSYRMLIHPGPCIIPAALATAELNGATGQEFITALAAGYEVESRIAGDFIPTTQARGFRCSPVYGTLGAAITTGKLLGLNEDQLVTALALACTFAAGTTEGPRVSGREMMYHEPQATRSGITAALLARENLKGSESCLEGEAGFYNAFTGNNRGELTYSFRAEANGGPDTTDLAKTVEGLGSRWELLHITPKIYPTAGYNCPVIELTTRARTSHNIAPEDVESITMEMNWLETTYPSPAFPNQDRSMPGVGSTHYFIAYTWVHGSYPPLRQRIDPGLGETETDRVVTDLQQRVEVIGQKDRANFAPRITIRTRSGDEFHDEFTGNELKWDLATETERISALFGDLPWPRAQLDGLVSTVTRLDQEPSIAGLIGTCVPA